jgi:hypothetical protein
MDNEARERLKNIARNLVDSSFAKACDDSFTEEDFQKSVEGLVNHLMAVRRRTRGVVLQKQMA